MWQRQNALLFNGIPEASGLDIQHEVLQLIHSKMGLSHISGTCLEQCHRLGIQKSDRIRPVVVFFHNHHIKAEVWNSKAKLKGSVFSICEFLTKARQSIHSKARKHFGMRNVWTFDEAIYIKHSSGREKITTQEQLDVLITRFPTASPSDRSLDGIPTVTTHEKNSGKFSLSNVNQQNKTARGKQVPAQIQSEETKRSRRLAIKK